MNESLGVGRMGLSDKDDDPTGKVHYLQLYCNLQ